MCVLVILVVFRSLFLVKRRTSCCDRQAVKKWRVTGIGVKGRMDKVNKLTASQGSQVVISRD
jgi:hypothetical protein